MVAERDFSDCDPCPVCGRPLVPGRSVNRHHLVPRLKGGKESFAVHTICHSKIHSLWTEAELAREFNTFAKIVADPRMQDFIGWVRKQDPEYKGRNASPRGSRGRRRRR